MIGVKVFGREIMADSSLEGLIAIYKDIARADIVDAYEKESGEIEKKIAKESGEPLLEGETNGVVMLMPVSSEISGRYASEWVALFMEEELGVRANSTAYNEEYPHSNINKPGHETILFRPVDRNVSREEFEAALDRMQAFAKEQVRLGALALGGEVREAANGITGSTGEGIAAAKISPAEVRTIG